MFHNVQAAFLFHGPRPAPGSFFFAGSDSPCAGPATDARIALIVQRIERNFVFHDELPHVALGPVEQWIDLYKAELCIPLHDSRLAAVRRLIAANGADPRLV